MKEINNPEHYTASKIQPINVVDEWELNFNLGNVIKYIARHKHKGSPLKDLLKAQWYLDREITLLFQKTDEEHVDCMK